MAELSTEKRNELKDSDFGIPEKRMYPLHDKSHVEAAVRLFGHAAPKYRKSLARKILARAREYNLDTSGWKQVLDYAQEQVPPMSDGTSTGNQPPHTMAPYCEEDELIQRLNRATAQAATPQPVQETDDDSFTQEGLFSSLFNKISASKIDKIEDMTGPLPDDLKTFICVSDYNVDAKFRYTMLKDDLYVPEMIPAVKHTWLIIHMFLFMITAGLYAFYLIIMVYKSTNDHLYNQWSYEIRLMKAMIKHEGGKGIKSVTKEEKEARKHAKRSKA